MRPPLCADHGCPGADRRRKRSGDLTTPQRVITGTAARDADAYRGWFVGHFIPPELGPRSTEAVEVKWGTHALGDTRAEWAASADATTLSVLVRGSIRILFANDQEALLAQTGDYALWPPGLAHRWRVEQDDTVVLTVRWPSRPADSVNGPRA